MNSCLCGEATQRQNMVLIAPPGYVLNAVVFASYGTPTGTCGSYATSSCNDPNSVSVITALCAGKTSCSYSLFPLVPAGLGDPCVGTLKHVYVQMSLSACPAGHYCPGDSQCALTDANCASNFKDPPGKYHKIHFSIFSFSL